MRQQDVVELYRTLEALGVVIWIDGGWGVDALLGEETRPHSDLDIAIEKRHLSGLTDLLARRGYTDRPRDDTSPWNFVLGDDEGRLVDIHVIEFDPQGRGIYGPPENGVFYPASALTGRGSIGGHPVRCISAEDMVRFHTGYAPRETDIADVQRLCDRFDVPLPEGFPARKVRPE